MKKYYFPLSQIRGMQWLKKFKSLCATKKYPMYDKFENTAHDKSISNKEVQEKYQKVFEDINISINNRVQKARAKREINNIFYLAVLLQSFYQKRVTKTNATKIINKINNLSRLKKDLARTFKEWGKNNTLAGFEIRKSLSSKDFNDISNRLYEEDTGFVEDLKIVKETLKQDLMSYRLNSSWAKYFKKQGKRTVTDKYGYLVFRILYLYKEILGKEVKKIKKPENEEHPSIYFVYSWLNLVGVNLATTQDAITLINFVQNNNFEYESIHEMKPTQFYDWVVETFPNSIGKFREYGRDIT